MVQYSYLREHSRWQLSIAANWHFSKHFSPQGTNLIEVSVDILSGAKVQVGAADLLGESRDADDIGRLQVLHEEIAAGFGHFFHLVAHSGQENVKNAGLANCDVRGVGKVNETADDLRTNVSKGDFWRVALLEVAGEHGFEVRTGGGQNQLMHLGIVDTCWLKKKKKQAETHLKLNHENVLVITIKCRNMY